VRIELAPEVERRLRSALRKAGRREIGGMLFAEQIAPGHFRITDLSVDPDLGSHAAFRRDPQKHGKALDEFFRHTDYDFARFNYLGEWHSHPSFAVQPSAEDLVTMTDIVESRSSPITFAVLLIVRLRWCLWLDYSLTVFARSEKPRQTRIRQRVVLI
jgi:integrative and conjugative element protein (TIGR02256 family)